MTKRCIVLGCGRRIGLGRYVEAWKKCLDLPPKTWIGRGVDGWGQTAGDALRDLRKGLNDRINKHLPWYGKGRKWESDWQAGMWRASRDVNNPRLLIHWLPPELMKVARFKERVEYARSN